MSEENIVLKVENLCQFFKMGNFENKAVNDISFDIKKGEVFGLVGESGCGKTTTGRTIIKLYEATSGNVYLKGRRICAGLKTLKEQLKDLKRLLKNESITEQARAEIQTAIDNKKKEISAAKDDQENCDKKYSKEMKAATEEEFRPQIESAQRKLEGISKESPEYAKNAEELRVINSKYRAAKHVASRDKFITQIQMIFQDPTASLNPRMTVRDLIAEGLIIKGIKDKKYIDQKVYEVLEIVGLRPEHAGRYQHEFSGGQRQRIGIARAIIMNPELLIADEPISALDVSIQAQVITLLNELREKIGLTILFIAHNLSVVKYFCDRIAVMFYGRIMEMAPANELFARPMHPYTRALLSAVPYPDPVFEKRRKRIIYNPLASHDYTVNSPELKEITPGHFVHCNQAEFDAYKKEYNL